MATQRQKKAVKAMVENGGIISKAMVSAGYSKATANTPQKLTESLGWKELMEQYLPDDLIAQKHRELLDASTIAGTPDYTSIKSGVDMAYKLKGSYAPDKTVSVNVELSVSDEDMSLAKKLLEQRSKTISPEGDGAVPKPLG